MVVVLVLLWPWCVKFWLVGDGDEEVVLSGDGVVPPPPPRGDRDRDGGGVCTRPLALPKLPDLDPPPMRCCWPRHC